MNIQYGNKVYKAIHINIHVIMKVPIPIEMNLYFPFNSFSLSFNPFFTRIQENKYRMIAKKIPKNSFNFNKKQRKAAIIAKKNLNQ